VARELAHRDTPAWSETPHGVNGATPRPGDPTAWRKQMRYMREGSREPHTPRGWAAERGNMAAGAGRHSAGRLGG